ncbi:bifunctional riboflavin kinase/FMN adenylyltransferase [Bifidobacterium gallicum]|uniref:FAD synthase n=1 Tax=Bifidobacterium gallicum DSM 20093 = LMG 11596 TaxID=561180 RepID=D1NV98_9BIFI|nr:riboflavin kinase [Bifidobacterium gallicum]EFA22749.1 riboflavin kinase [Bifidobacterium gallicum DSM 20093 = LMG 11596]KFI59693.1 FAD synthase [Bifidobacterium gallicum DSM 20093 = LMG 11596]
MKIFRLNPQADGTVEWPLLDRERKSVVTVGVFDGLHRGHQAVVERVVQIAHKLDLFSVVIMFDPRPGFVHAYAKQHDGADVPDTLRDANLLTDVDRRLQLLQQLGVDVAIVVHYTMAFSRVSYLTFLGNLVGKLGMRTLVLGEDAALGAERKGTVERIRTIADGTGMFELDVVDDRGPGKTRVPPKLTGLEAQVLEGQQPSDPRKTMTKAQMRAWSKKLQAKLVRELSSTNIRYLLNLGVIEDANALLGRAHAVEGVVVHGEERGRTLGFPTANVGAPVDGYLPADGVYAGWLVDLGPADQSAATDQMQEQETMEGEQEHGRWAADISIGTKPTYSELTGLHERVLEANAITDDWLDLYGHRVRVEFVQFLRPQIKFESSDALKAELERNAEQAWEICQAQQKQ